MDFSLSDEQQALQDTVRRFAQAELVQAAQQIEDDDEQRAPTSCSASLEWAFLDSICQASTVARA